MNGFNNGSMQNRRPAQCGFPNRQTGCAAMRQSNSSCMNRQNPNPSYGCAQHRQNASGERAQNQRSASCERAQSQRNASGECAQNQRNAPRECAQECAQNQRSASCERAQSQRSASCECTQSRQNASCGCNRASQNSVSAERRMPRQNIARPYTSGQNSMLSRQNVSAGQSGAAQPDRTCPPDAMNKAQLLDYLDQVSFAVDDILLYLDTHPCDREAMKYFREQSENRNLALKEYAKRFGPLTIDTAVLCEEENWEWISQPWPWEGGCN